MDESSASTMDQIIIFDKSYEQRFEEYLDVLSGFDTLPVSQIKKQWSFYLELVIDPNGWQAIWKIHKLTCEKLKIPHPTVVLVYVDNVDFKELTASVKILAVQDDIHLPATYTVPLVQMWPTKQQDDTVSLNLPATANALDMMRFFYNHLWRPWDIDDDDNVDWISKHLEVRLRLHYDMKTEVIPRHTAEHLRSLLAEARLLQEKRERLEEDLDDEGDLDVDFNNSVNKVDLNESVQSLMEIHLRMTQLKNEVDILENPILRNVLIKRNKSNETNQTEKEKQDYWLIMSPGYTVNDYLELLNKVKSNVGENTIMQISTLVQSALDEGSKGDVIVLCAGQHRVKSTAALENGGKIVGLPECTKETVVYSTNDDIMLDFSGSECILENLTVNAGFVQCGIMARKGRLLLRNCILMGQGQSSIHQGIIVLAGCDVVLDTCILSGFYTGIIANSKSKVTLRNCTIESVDIALKLFDDCQVTVTDCSVTNNRVYGIYLETEKTDKMTVGDVSLLETVPNISVVNSVFASNQRGDVIIEPKFDVMPVRDLFSNPAFNTILTKKIVDVSDEEQDVEMNSENNSLSSAC